MPNYVHNLYYKDEKDYDKFGWWHLNSSVGAVHVCSQHNDYGYVHYYVGYFKQVQMVYDYDALPPPY